MGHPSIISNEALQSADSLANLAYDRIEDLIVHSRLAPGQSTTVKALQLQLDIGRTPIHQAVRRLAAETLIQIRPRDGLNISPIDLARDRRLLRLRREMDRFVVELASDRLDGNPRHRLTWLGTILRERASTMDVEAFNAIDRQLDAILLEAAGEPFLEQTLKPLHTIFRRIGHLHLTHVGGAAALRQTIDRHLELLEAVVDRDTTRASNASDRLIDFADSMFDSLEARIAPELLDIRLAA